MLRPELAATLGPDRFCAKSRSPPNCSIRTSCRCSTPARPRASSSTSCPTSRVNRSASGWPARRAAGTRGDPDAARRGRCALLRPRRGVVHRDIKPDNVMLSGRHALVADFGVAKAVSEATGRQSLTTAGVALGTPAYMAPEQAAADPHVDHRADIYAWARWPTAAHRPTALHRADPPGGPGRPRHRSAEAVTRNRAACPPALAERSCAASRSGRPTAGRAPRSSSSAGVARDAKRRHHTYPDPTDQAVRLGDPWHGHPVRVAGCSCWSRWRSWGGLFLTIQLGLPDWVPGAPWYCSAPASRS